MQQNAWILLVFPAVGAWLVSLPLISDGKDRKKVRATSVAVPTGLLLLAALAEAYFSAAGHRPYNYGLIEFVAVAAPVIAWGIVMVLIGDAKRQRTALILSAIVAAGVALVLLVAAFGGGKEKIPTTK